MESIQILWLNRSFTPKGTGVKTHTHPYYHFFVMTEGTLTVTVEDETYEVSKGSSLLVPKQAEHSYLNHSTETAGCLEIKFTLQNPGLESRLTDGKHAAVVSDPAVVILSEKLTEELASLGALADEAAKSYLNAILQIMTRPNRIKSEKETYIDVTGCSELTKQVVSYLEAHYQSPCSLEDLSKALSFNKAYLCTAFKKDMKVTIADCLNLIRIRQAAKMISYSELSIGEVAKACGFGTASHFNHVFQHYIGTTPSAVRKAYPNHILLESEEKDRSKTFHPGRMLYNVLAGKMITPESASKN
ncbi:MAG: AraC family transcriptional regulator [Lachnospiraceae bacterium]|nr:AraC family transcriptional regulator [Lachnospiraceae bacterium]